MTSKFRNGIMSRRSGRFFVGRYLVLTVVVAACSVYVTVSLFQLAFPSSRLHREEMSSKRFFTARLTRKPFFTVNWQKAHENFFSANRGHHNPELEPEIEDNAESEEALFPDDDDDLRYNKKKAHHTLLDFSAFTIVMNDALAAAAEGEVPDPDSLVFHQPPDNDTTTIPTFVAGDTVKRVTGDEIEVHFPHQYIQDNSILPCILDELEESNKRIYFFDSDNPAKSCAIESAAKHNPNSKITVLNLSGQQREEKHENVEYYPIDTEACLKKEPLLYEMLERYPKRALLKLLVLYRYGGAVSNFDHVFRASIEHLRNTVGAIGSGRMGSDLLIFDKENPLVRHMIDRLHGGFVTDLGSLLSSAIVADCSTIRDRVYCRNVDVLAREKFYPLSKKDEKLLLSETDSDIIELKIADSFVVNTWNASRADPKKAAGTPYQHLMKMNCRNTYTDRFPVM